MAEEKKFEAKVKRYLKSKNIWYVKYFGNAYSTNGIPDLLCCVNGLFLALELKSEQGKVSSLQNYNIKKIQESGGYAFIIRPSDFEDLKEIIEDMLK